MCTSPTGTATATSISSIAQNGSGAPGVTRYITQGATGNVNGHPPHLASSSPADDSTGVSDNADITLTFDEAVSEGTTGNIYIVRTSDNTIVETIPIGDARITGSGTTWTINPNITLTDLTGYAVRIDAGTFHNSDGAVFFGINDNTTLNFTTGSSATIAVGTIAGDNIVNASEAGAGFAISGTSTGADGQTATIEIVNSANAIVDTYMVTIAAGGGWTANVTAAQALALADGSYTVKADVSTAPEATRALTVDETAPTIAIGSIAGDDTVNAVEAAAGVAISDTSSGADGQTATITIVDGSNAVKDTYTVTIAAGGGWTTNVTAAQAQALADGSYTVKADVSDAAGNPAVQATRALGVDETPPTIAIGTIAGDNTVNVAEAAAGVAVSGTSSGADGQTATIRIVDGSSAVKATYTVTIAAGGGWTANVTAAQAQALADGSYTAKAHVSDAAAIRRWRRHAR